MTEASQKIAKWRIRVEATIEPATKKISPILSNFKAYKKRLNPQMARQQQQGNVTSTIVAGQEITEDDVELKDEEIDGGVAI